ncbi:hypothetical protein [Sphingomonas alpina]|uniref:DUF1311 domain-containing protein n=1 Tax=Sphingomonas alpina TaxID=653931 RepID=A0A7H0LNM2_9SPHN|nr:hypothetical protein [Sphingomonas alpina]QNQ11275.1 hypothetical protein H3Z74_09055 [Sphingomonas alpina]
MRRTLTAFAIVWLGIPGAVSAQTGSGGRADLDAPELDDLNVAKVFFRGGCFSYEFGGNGNFIDSEEDDFLWTGECVAGQPINGSGVFKRVTVNGSLKGNWTETSATYVDGVQNGRYTWNSFVPGNSPDHRNFNGSGTITRGCDDSENDQYCVADFSKLAKKRGLVASHDPAIASNAADRDQRDDDVGSANGQQCQRLASIMNSPAPTIGALASLTHTVAVLKASIAMIDLPCGKPWIVSNDRAAIAQSRAQQYEAWKTARTGCLQLTAGVASEAAVAALDDDNPCKEVVQPS